MVRALHHGKAARRLELKTEIAKLESRTLQRGAILEAWREGAPAVILQSEHLAERVWDELIVSRSCEEAGQETLPWMGTLDDLSANFIPSMEIYNQLGDVIYTQPGQLTYIARKIRLSQDRNSNELRCEPRVFVSGEREYRLSQRSLETVWELARKVAWGLGGGLDNAPVELHRLCYEREIDKVWRRRVLFSNALGYGHGDGRHLSRLSSTNPVGRKLLKLFNKFPSTSLAKGLSDIPLVPVRDIADEFGNTWIAGGPHTDGRIYSALLGRRSRHMTQIKVGKTWLELPVNTADVAIIPGREAERTLGIPATVHRILNQQCGMPATDQYGRDITVLLGVNAN